ncbi:DUF948 domain-containing protein [Oceanobacillus damuensis]|uniref:DUF948 domain-containing protein n=1 Tax=Oceanobacillus damuensis TaxID=937928 RepID=UPI000835DADB|nr:DUF948 domain-containing protein [Oceanobacillus damuensis]
MEIIYVGILLCSIAFAIVVIYLSLVLNRVTKTVKSLGTSMGELEKELEYITPQLTQTVRESDKLVDDISEKIRATDSLFDSVEEMGTAVNSLNEVYSKKTKALTNVELEQKMKPFVGGITWSEAAVQLYTKWKTTKRAGKNEVMVQKSKGVPANTGSEG